MPKTARVAILAIGGVALLLAYARLFFGIDFHDEAYAIAVPYSFLLGNTPFHYDIFPYQTTSLLVAPFLWVYLKAMGSTLGIVLFVRHLYFVFIVAASVAVYTGLRRRLSLESALIATLPVPLFLPAALPSLFNNILGFSLLCGGALLSSSPQPFKFSRLVGGALFAVAGFAYPVMLVPIAAYYGSAWALRIRENGLRGVMTRCESETGFAIVCVGFLVVLAVIGLPEVIATYMLAASFKIWGGGAAKILHMAATAARVWNEMLRYGGVLIPALLLAFSLLPRIRVWALPWSSLIWLTLPFVVAGEKVARHVTEISLTPFSLAFLMVLAGFGAVAAITGKTSRLIAGIGTPAAIAGLVGGVTIAFTSSNGISNFPIGGFLLLIAVVIYVVDSLHVKGGGKLEAVRKIAACVSLVAVMLYFQYSRVYWDVAPITKLTARMTSGPYAGIYGSPEKAAFLIRAETLLSLHTQHGKTLLVLDDFPAGYLTTDLRPLTRAIWLFRPEFYPNIPRQLFLDFHSQPEHQPDYVLMPLRMMLTADFTWTFSGKEQDPLRKLFVDTLRYRLVAGTQDMQLLERPGLVTR